MAKQKITFNFGPEFHSKLQRLAEARGITRTAVLEFLVHNAELALWENAPKSSPDIKENGIDYIDAPDNPPIFQAQPNPNWINDELVSAEEVTNPAIATRCANQVQRRVVGRPNPDKIAEFQRKAGMAGGKGRK